MPTTNRTTPINTKKSPKNSPTANKSQSKPAKPAASALPNRPSSRKRRGGGMQLPQISADTVMDIIGLGMVFFGLFLGLVLFSVSNSGFSAGVRQAVESVLGMGIYLLPLGLTWAGGWLAMRRFDAMPAFNIRIGLGVFLALLFAQVALAIFGVGLGGSLGDGLLQWLVNLLGKGGMLVAMVAWLLVTLSLLFGMRFGGAVGAAFGLLGRGFAALGAAMSRAISGRPGAPKDEWEPDRQPYVDGYLPVEPDYDGTLPIGGAMPMAEAEPVEHGKPVRLEPSKIDWKLPLAKDLLVAGNPSKVDDEAIEEKIRVIEEALKYYGAPGKVVDVSKGPTVTQFGVEPGFLESRNGRVKVRVSKIASLSDDLAMALAAPRIRIQAPVPGHSFVGIEVPNTEMTMVTLRDIVESDDYKNKRKPLTFALGRDVSGRSVVVDLGTMPHLLIAGTTGSGKSVCVNAMLSCLLLNNSPEDLRLVLVDPKRVELTGYNGIPHLLSSVIVETERVLGALQWMTREMDKRYKTFSAVGARNIDDYNRRMVPRGEKKIPYIVVVIDELADLMMVAPDETEHTITRLAQLARATGIHLVLATQRPSVNVMTGLIKANIPARIAFAVSSNTDSRVILDKPGAERLLGKGDMLYMDPAAAEPARLQGVYVSDDELHALVDFWVAQTPQGGLNEPGEGRVDQIGDNLPLKQTSYLPEDITVNTGKDDVLLEEATAFVRGENRASVSMLQRKFKIGYTRASRLIETMEERKIVGAPKDATGIRPILWEDGEQSADQ